MDKKELKKEIIKELTKQDSPREMERKYNIYMRRVILWERIKRIFYTRC